MSNDPIEWLLANIELKHSNSAEFWYERMESQSGEILPLIYVPFNGNQQSHFIDRGQILDYAISSGGGRVLDFGPGDGWPSLLIASMVSEVVGVDASKRRVEICIRNARKLRLENVRFIHVKAGHSLPFNDNSFDAVTAASSIEQTPNAKSTLKELHRILKPNGRLRMNYESLSYYCSGREREIALGNPNEHPNYLLIYDRNIDEECVQHYLLVLDLSKGEIEDIFRNQDAKPSYTALTPKILTELCKHLVDAGTWTTQHPSCRTFLRLLKEVGFRSARPTYNGGWFAKRLFDNLTESQRPQDMDAVDKLLRPLVEVVVTMETPSVVPSGEWEPWITATK